MHDDPVYRKNCPSEVVDGLIEIVSAALITSFPDVTVDVDDVGSVIDALHVLRPNVAEIGTLDGLLYIVQSRWEDAIYTLRFVCERAPNFSYAHMLLAYALAFKGDDTWRLSVEDAMRIAPRPEIKHFQIALTARSDLIKAMELVDRGGEFRLPDSVGNFISLRDSEEVNCIDESISEAEFESGLTPLFPRA